MRIYNENNTEILQLDGDINGALVEELETELSSLKEKKISRVALDMKQVGYIYSRGIGVLVRAQKELTALDGAMYLFNLKPSVQKILMEINLMDYLNAFATKEEMDFELFRDTNSKEDPSLELGLNIEEKKLDNGSWQLKLTGTIDSPSDVELLHQVCQNKIKEGVKSILFELSDLIYADDKGIYEWVHIKNEIEASGGKLTLKGINEIILDQLNIMEMLGHFHLED